MTADFVEPYRIKMVEHIHLSTRHQRRKWLQDTQYNLLKLKSEQIFIDLLTDSGTGAMSDKQWSAMITGDESYAGSTSYYQLKTVVEQLFDMPYFLPAHQGRAAENVLFSAMLQKGDIVPGNMHFFTTKEHITIRHAKAIDCPIKEAFDHSNQFCFKGNIDLNKLEDLFKKHAEKIPFVILTVTSNSVGGLPVSMENIKKTAALCKKHHSLMLFDAARFAENAYFIKKNELAYKNKNIKTIVKTMFSYVDGFVMSAKKDGIVNMGGLIGLKSKDLYDKASIYTIRYEGFLTYGGLAGKDLAALAQGLLESTDFQYLESRVKQVAYLGNQIEKHQIPVLKPFGGHAVFINAKAFYPHIPSTEYPANLLNVELYQEGGIRGVAIDALSSDRDPKTKKEHFPKIELLRLAIPRRTYTNNHMDYVATMAANVFKKRNQIKHGFKITKEAPTLRHFTIALERL